jgi:hypothetical protein
LRWDFTPQPFTSRNLKKFRANPLPGKRLPTEEFLPSGVAK